MLGKLIKYEFKATSRIFLPLFAALLVVSAITKLMIGLQLQAPQVISIILSVMLIAAAFVITLILTIQRFYRNFMTDEGYLMHTLPVSTDQLIWSKMIVAAVWNIVCAVAVFASISIMAFNNGEFIEFLRSLTHLGLPSFGEGLLVTQFVVLVLVTLLANILMIYASMALSMLGNKHRVAFSFGIYIGLTTALQILIGLGLLLFNNPSMAAFSGTMQEFFDQYALGFINTVMLVSILITAAVGAGFFTITRYMLKNKLNLQ